MHTLMDILIRLGGGGIMPPQQQQQPIDIVIKNSSSVTEMVIGAIATILATVIAAFVVWKLNRKKND